MLQKIKNLPKRSQEFNNLTVKTLNPNKMERTSKIAIMTLPVIQLIKSPVKTPRPKRVRRAKHPVGEPKFH